LPFPGQVESLTAARKNSGTEPSDALRVVNAVLTQLDSIRNSVPNPDPRVFCLLDPDPDPRVFGLMDPDPLVRGMDPDPTLDPDPSIIMQK
jgi:hypothetical protein